MTHDIVRPARSLFPFSWLNRRFQANEAWCAPTPQSQMPLVPQHQTMLGNDINGATHMHIRFILPYFAHWSIESLSIHESQGQDHVPHLCAQYLLHLLYAPSGMLLAVHNHVPTHSARRSLLFPSFRPPTSAAIHELVGSTAKELVQEAQPCRSLPPNPPHCGLTWYCSLETLKHEAFWPVLSEMLSMYEHVLIYDKVSCMDWHDTTYVSYWYMQYHPGVTHVPLGIEKCYAYDVAV